jgi:hypothetical protein
MSVQNKPLFNAVQAVRAAFRSGVIQAGHDMCSSGFLCQFPFAILRFDNRNAPFRANLMNAGFAIGFGKSLERTIEICYANHGGGTIESYFVSLVEDFLNFALPRTVGLPNEDELFELISKVISLVQTYLSRSKLCSVTFPVVRASTIINIRRFDSRTFGGNTHPR